MVSDVSDLEHVERLRDLVLDTFGRVDVIVNNAGAAHGDDRRPVVDLDPDRWRTVIDVNLTGTFLMSKVFGRVLVDQGQGGSIVNISSIAGKTFSPDSSAYAASKAGVQAMTACMAREVGSYGVRVNAVCPGLVDTSRMDALGRGEAWEQMVRDVVPLRRAGTGDDIAFITTFLCSDQGALGRRPVLERRWRDGRPALSPGSTPSRGVGGRRPPAGSFGVAVRARCPAAIGWTDDGAAGADAVDGLATLEY